MASVYVQSALSFGVESYEALWKIQYIHPYDAGKRMTTWVPMTADDELIGQDVAEIRVAAPGPRLVEVMGWLYDRITRYPYYWPKEGTYVNKFGYDFEVELSGEDTTTIEITQAAYDILKIELRIQPPDPSNTNEVDIQYDVVPGGGVIIKLAVTLDRSQPVSELNIAPFTKYPMELVSLMYEEDIETFHPKKEIVNFLADPDKISALQNGKTPQTTESIRVQFPVVTAKRITLILRQKNAEKNTYLVNPDIIGKTDLWATISQREAEVTLDTKDGLETVAQSELNKISGWDIYLQEFKKYQEDLLKWQKDFDLYKQKQAERNAKLNEQKAEQVRFATAQSEYRAEYKAAVAKYKTRVANYNHDLANYNAAYAKYQKDLVIYNKYLRDYSAWKSKWG